MHKENTTHKTGTANPNHPMALLLTIDWSKRMTKATPHQNPEPKPVIAKAVPTKSAEATEKKLAAAMTEDREAVTPAEPSVTKKPERNRDGRGLAMRADALRGRVGQVATGTVVHVDGTGDALMSIDGMPVILRREDMLPEEGVRPDQRVRVMLNEVRKIRIDGETRSFGMASRRDEAVTRDAIESCCEELRSGRLTIDRIAQVPGKRVKVAVTTMGSRSETELPSRDAREQAGNLLAGARVDILWGGAKASDADETELATLVSEALGAFGENRVTRTTLEGATIHATVGEGAELGRICGAGRVNLRLAGELLGHPIVLHQGPQRVDGTRRTPRMRKEAQRRRTHRTRPCPKLTEAEESLAKKLEATGVVGQAEARCIARTIEQGGSQKVRTKGLTGHGLAALEMVRTGYEKPSHVTEDGLEELQDVTFNVLSDDAIAWACLATLPPAEGETPTEALAKAMWADVARNPKSPLMLAIRGQTGQGGVDDRTAGARVAALITLARLTVAGEAETAIEHGEDNPEWMEEVMRSTDPYGPWAGPGTTYVTMASEESNPEEDEPERSTEDTLAEAEADDANRAATAGEDDAEQ